jgi:hypothetical protein
MVAVVASVIAVVVAVFVFVFIVISVVAEAKPGPRRMAIVITGKGGG